MAKVFSYLRFSRPEQMKGDSQRRQLERTEAWVERNGHVLDQSLDLRDLGKSAFRGKNVTEGRLGAFLEAIETGKVKSGSFLVLENLDRLSRNEVFEEALPLVQRIIKAGVSIVTLDPERVYSRKTVREIGPLLEMLLALFLANEESRKKAERLSEAWKAKRKNAETRKLTTIAPKWLKAVKDEAGRLQGFEPIPERVEVVERIFQLAGDGLGVEFIAKTLNREEVPTFGRSDFWHRSYVTKVLKNRAVLGEYQPHRMVDGKREPIGEVIADYFPAVIEEADFYAAQRNRKLGKQNGRHANRVSNLFTGLVRDARDGGSMVIVDKRSKSNPGKGGQPSLVSSAATVGKPGAVYLSFPYPAFEQSLLAWAWDLKLGDVLPRKSSNLEKQIQKAEGRVADLTHRIKTLKKKIKSAGDVDALLDLLVDLDSDKKEAEAKVERLKQDNATKESEALDRMKELVGRLNGADEDEAYRLRVKLRTTLKRLIEDVVVLVVQVNKDRLALVDIQFKNGTRRQATIMSGKRVPVPEELEGLDVREWADWPKEAKATKFEPLTDEARQMMDMEDQGMTRADIARELGCSVSQVSRTLRKLGREKGTKKKADSPELMNWHEAGRGWVKTKDGQRFFIGLGNLKKAFPRRVKAMTREGSWKAANAWWKAKLAEIGQSPAGCSM